MNLAKGFDYSTHLLSVKSDKPHLFVSNKDPHLTVVAFIKHLAGARPAGVGPLAVLDIGGNSGQGHELMVRSTPGVDYTSLDFVAKAPTTGEVQAKVVVGNVQRCNSKIPSGLFHVVMATNVFEHLLDGAVAAQEVVRLVANGGYVVITVPFAWRYHAYPMDVIRYTHTGMRYIFERFGGVRTLFAAYWKRGVTNQGSYRDHSDFHPNSNMKATDICLVVLLQRVDGIVFDPSSFDSNSAFDHVESSFPVPGELGDFSWA